MLFAQGSTASKYCDNRNPDGSFIDVPLAIRAWSKARWLGAPDYPKWQRPALIIWHPQWDFVTTSDKSHLKPGQPLRHQRWGMTYSETQVDKKGRVSLCEYVEIWVPESTLHHDYRSLTVEILAHEYLHLIWIRRMHLEPDFKLEQTTNWLDGGESWVRALLDQQDGPVHH